jgi:hypothetical protein
MFMFGHAQPGQTVFLGGFDGCCSEGAREYTVESA